MTKPSVSKRSDSAAGFTLIELLVVFAIIAITAATALPSLLGYLRNYAISGAAKDVAREIQSARNRAIMRNTNNGVSIILVDNANYRWIMEDDVDPQSANPAENWFAEPPDVDDMLTLAALADQLGPPRMLPGGIFFDVIMVFGCSVYLRLVGKEKRRRDQRLQVRLDEKLNEQEKDEGQDSAEEEDMEPYIAQVQEAA